ncbi:MAG: PAS domain S-box protein [Bacteroidales bacterium]|nr:PAS domain S-box protein [Bacteroidales bacterium]
MTELHFSEKMLSELINYSPQCISVTSIAEGRFIEVNANFEKSIGIPRGEIIGKTPEGLGVLFYDSFIDNLKQELINSGKIDSREGKMVLRDGSEVLFIISGRIIEINGESFLISFADNITEKRKAEEEHKEFQNYFNLFFNQALEGIFFFMLDEPIEWNDSVDKDKIIDYVFSNQRIVRANDAFLNQYGITLSQALTMTPADFYSSDPEYGKRIWKEFFDKGRLHTETSETKADGTQIFIEGDYICLYDSKGKISGNFGIQRDITEKKRSEELLIKSEEQYKYLFENNPHPMWIYDVKTLSFLMVNNTAINSYGYSGEEFLKMTLKDIRPSEDWADLEQDVKNTPEIAGMPKRWRHIKKSGELIYVEISSFPIIFENKKARLVLSRDVTDRVKSEDALILAKNKAEESDRIKSTFLATMSHELRTPLNAIIGFSDLMKDDISKEEIDSFAMTIHKSGRHLLGLIEEIFDISLIEAGEIKLQFEEFEVNDLLNEIFAVISREQILLGKNSIKLRINIPANGDKVRISIDQKRFKQILVNLLKNALKFTKEGYIEYGFTFEHINENGFLKFYVKDTGIGIAKDKQQLIFDQFRQADDSLTRTYGGTGLGLSISKKLVEILGGEIWVESETGKGSTFFFTLPSAKLTSVPVNPVSAVSDIPEYDFSGKKLLLAEDDDPSFLLLKAMLRKTGIEIIRAKNGIEAVSLSRSESDISLILMDINMPEMNGYEATKIIKAEKPYIPVIAQTAYSISGDKERTIESGCDDYISKPIKKQELFRLIQKYI